MKYKIINNSDSSVELEDQIQGLVQFAGDRFGFKKPPMISLNHDKENASKILGKTGYYDPSTMEIHIFATGSHPKDILRSIAHELVHHMQNERGDFANAGETGPGYAQNNPRLRELEAEAYREGNLCFRDYEDGQKQNESTNYNNRRKTKMSLNEWKNKELSNLMTNKFGFKMDLGKLNEAARAEPGENTKEPNFKMKGVRYSKSEVEMHAKKGNKDAQALLALMGDESSITLPDDEGEKKIKEEEDRLGEDCNE